MERTQRNKKLFAIGEMIDNFLNSNSPILNNTYTFLEKIQNIALDIEEEEKPISINPLFVNTIKVSSASSITQSPNEQTSIGYVINFNDKKQININSARFSKSTTRTQADYDAIYFALITLFDLSSGINLSKPIIVESGNTSVISQLNGEVVCQDEKLKHKRDTILELVQQMENISILFNWKPRKATEDLYDASNLAENLLSTKNH